MSNNNPSKEENVEEIDTDLSSVDNFIKELEEKEKDLHISSDLVIEVGDSDVDEDNLHMSFQPNNPPDPAFFENSLNGYQVPPNDYTGTDSNLQEELKKLRNEKKELQESILRRQRDFDNYRNRTERERHETFKGLVVSLATQMLPVLDNLNRALDASISASEQKEGDFETFVQGVVMVNQQLNEVLANMGINPIPSVNQPFDPHFHEAVASEETDEVAPDTVIEEVLRGYKVDDKVIRPSMVKVSTSVKTTVDGERRE